MGFASWLTADKRESIYNRYTDKCKPVYLLQPNGETPIRDDAYDGYFHINGVPAYAWVAKRNLPKSMLEGKDDYQLQGLGIRISEKLNSFYLNNVYCVMKDEEEIVNYLHLIPESQSYLVMDYDDLVELPTGEFVKCNSQRLLSNRLKPAIPYPLKLSFNPDAIYENYPASEICPNQGFFGGSDK